MPPLNPAESLQHTPIADLIVLLLKQFQRLLQERNIALTSADMQAIAQAAAHKAPLPEKALLIREILAALIAESESLLKTRWNLTFAESLKTGMEALGGWETTAEFLEIANEKSNAELRISAGASLLMALGDRRYGHHLLTIIEHDAGLNDVEAVIARRVLTHTSGIEPDTDAWLQQVKLWLAE
jgi:hypothetical protein